MDITHTKQEAKELWAELGKLINKEFKISGWIEGEPIQEIIKSQNIKEMEYFIHYTKGMIRLIKET